MAIYNVHAGHNYKTTGANGYLFESKENRVVKDKVIALLRAQGHTVYDCTDEDGATQAQNLANIVAKCNAHVVDLDISIHFNAFNTQAKGTQVYIRSESVREISDRICARIASLGFVNRGSVVRPELYVLKHTNAFALLVECCFCDNKEDAERYDPDKMAKAIVEGILNKSIDGSSTPSTPSAPSSGTEEMYRVRKSWEDASSQLGAYTILDNAIKNCKDGYFVYDSKGNVVYPESTKPSQPAEEELYRVRKSWNDEQSQIGAYTVLENAKKNCKEGYNVYDSKGNVVFSNSTVAEQPEVVEQMYRIRKSWEDVSSQLGAYKSLEGAKKNCPTGYNVYDSNGKLVYDNTPDPVVEELYRVRKSWEDSKSQLGAYTELENAKNKCLPGYNVYDSKGNVVYSVAEEVAEPDPEPAKPEDTTPENDRWYRVRKSWEDASSQLGAYKDKDIAISACKYGYTVYDWLGNAIHTNDTPETPDISPLKGVSNKVFIEYVGRLAREDMKKTGILASVTIAQAILESGWGQTELALKANNLFGMKSYLSGNTWASEWDGKIYAKRTAEEYEVGVITYILADFRLYDHPDKSIKDHSDYLCGAMNGNKLRYEGLKGETDYKKAIQIIKDGGYATASTYVEKIIGIIEKHNLAVWDIIEPEVTPDEPKEEVPEVKPEEPKVDAPVEEPKVEPEVTPENPKVEVQPEEPKVDTPVEDPEVKPEEPKEEIPEVTPEDPKVEDPKDNNITIDKDLIQLIMDGLKAIIEAIISLLNKKK